MTFSQVLGSKAVEWQNKKDFLKQTVTLVASTNIISITVIVHFKTLITLIRIQFSSTP